MLIDEEKFAAILADVVAGDPVRRALLARNVNPRDFYAMLDADEERAKRYARAKASGLDALADDTVRIADDRDIAPDHKRVMVDTRKWLLAKLAPKKYGERTVIAGDADSPLAVGLVEPKAELLRRLVAGAAAGATGSPDSGADG